MTALRESRAARMLMGLGLTVGVVAAAVAALDVQLNLPDWMIRVAMIKLAFIAAGGLMGAGALLARHSRSRSLTREAVDLLGEGPAQPLSSRQADVERSVDQDLDRSR